MFSFFSHLKVLREEKAKVCNDKCFQCVDRRAGVSTAGIHQRGLTEDTVQKLHQQPVCGWKCFRNRRRKKCIFKNTRVRAHEVEVLVFPSALVLWVLFFCLLLVQFLYFQLFVKLLVCVCVCVSSSTSLVQPPSLWSDTFHGYKVLVVL